MTKEILVINPKRKPRRRRKTAAKKRRRNANGTFAKMRKRTNPARRRSKSALSARGGRTMAKRRKATRKRRTPTRTIAKAVRRRRRATPRRNPSRRAAVARRATSAFKNVLNVRNVIEAAQGTGGMLATQFFAKRFADGGGANDSDWTWKNYTWGAVGAVGSGLAASLVSQRAGKEFFKGGLSLLMYKLVVNEWAEKSDFISEYFGEADETVFMGDDGNMYSPGDTYLGDDGEVYLMGQDGSWNNAYLGPETALGEALVPPGSLGEALVPPGSLGEDPYTRTFGEDPYARVFNN